MKIPFVPFSKQVEEVFRQWWETYEQAPECASINTPSLERMAKESRIHPMDMGYQFGAKPKLRLPGYAQSPVEYYSYSRKDKAITPSYVLKAIEDWYVDNAPPEHLEDSEPTGPQG